jgi:phosphoribosylformylglycinamidine (FGAM) synthase-like enzyme
MVLSYSRMGFIKRILNLTVIGVIDSLSGKTEADTCEVVLSKLVSQLGIICSTQLLMLEEYMQKMSTIV